MQAVKLKRDIISYVTELTDKKLLQELYQWVVTKENATPFIHSVEFTSPKHKSSLTDGYGIWADDEVSNDQDYRKKIWGTEKNIW
ncbi:hypothetical protein AGMMS49965_05410 [Bacteroidia bacterium]|nr:hypothetical protein AGMMS49965_05410 [Bacteroidia bacterium]